MVAEFHGLATRETANVKLNTAAPCRNCIYFFIRYSTFDIRHFFFCIPPKAGAKKERFAFANRPRLTLVACFMLSAFA
jgi:hypothetical protein